MSFSHTILETTMDLFPGSPIHVGGDECPGTGWLTDPASRRLLERAGAQAWFEAQVCGYVLDAGRRVIAWDEVLDGQVDPAVTIRCWHDGERAAEALRRGHDLIASPAPLTYLDHDQVLGPTRPVSAGGPVPLEDLTALSPLLTDLSAQAGAGGPSGRRAGRLLGAQVQLWTEYVRSWARA